MTRRKGEYRLCGEPVRTEDRLRHDLVTAYETDAATVSVTG
jgi:hypothetical protein